MREQRAFAAVHDDGTIFIRSIALTEWDAECLFGAAWKTKWVKDAPAAEHKGWRIRPVLIRIEDNGGSDAE